MKIESALLADHAEVVGSGLLNVTGGGWNHVDRDTFPAYIEGFLALTLRLEPEDHDRGFVRVGTAVSLKDGPKLSDGSAVELLLTESTVSVVPLAVRFSFEMPHPGLFGVTLASADDGPLAAVECEARQT